MKMLLRSLMPLAGLVVASAAPADEKTPEAILAEKELVRDGVTLVLKDAATRDEKIARIDEAAGLVRDRLEPLLAARQQLKQRVDEAERDASTAKNEEEEEVTRYDSKGK